MPIAASPPGTLLAFAAEVLGEPVLVRDDLAWPHAESAVWRLEGPAGTAILKAHRTAAKHARERSAYRRWGPSLAGSVPRLLGVHATPRALLLEDRPGRVCAAPSERSAASLHRSAGGWLARFHALPHEDDDPLDLADAYGQRADAWFRRARAALPAPLLREARVRLEETLPALAGRSRVPCHRDFTPRNWLAVGASLGAAIDLEHARPDLPEIDLVRLASHLWPQRPDLRDAFLSGYGADTPPPWLVGLEVLEAVATVAWAQEHADPGFEADGRRVLERHLGPKNGAPSPAPATLPPWTSPPRT